MPLPPGLPIVDHHCHLSPTGEGVAAARRFADAGGTHLFLATQNYSGGPIVELEQYRTQFETTERLAHRIRDEVGVSVYPVVAPYPVDLIGARDALGLARAEELHGEALELAGAWVRERRAVALGEVGRPHFPVEDEIAEASDRLLLHALRTARAADCPAVVHCEELDRAGYALLGRLAHRAGLPAGRLVKHFARAVLPAEERGGIVPSYLARRELAVQSLGGDGPWFWETDFLDDPRRPGAVLDLATVPRRAAWVVEHHRELADRLCVPFLDAVRQVYGLELDPAGGP